MWTRIPAGCWIVLVLAIAGAVSGCGSGPRVRVSGRVLHLRLEEYRIVPQDVVVRAGELKIVAYNAGILTHNVAVELRHRGPGGGFVLGSVSILLPSHSGSVRLTLAPGRYQIASTVGNQADLGMTGTLTVQP